MKHYYTLDQCAGSIEFLTDLANKARGARQPTYSQLELLTAHSRQITAMLRDRKQAEAILVALLQFRQGAP